MTSWQLKNSIFSVLIIALACSVFPASVPAAESLDYSLTLGEMTFDPGRNEPIYPAGWGPVKESGSDLHLVQVVGPTRSSWLQDLESGGLEIVQYIHPFTYVVWGTEAQLESVNRAEIVNWTGPFAPAYRVLPKWQNLSSAMVELDILFYRGADVKAVIADLESLGAIPVEHSVLNRIYEIAGFEMPGNALQAAARIPGVYSIQLRPTDGGLRSEMSNQINANNMDGTNLAFPGYYSWLSTIGLDGSGVIMANVDGGIDHAHADLVNRMLSCTGDTCGGSATDSHGTHTAGIMVADGNSGTTDTYGFLRGLGVAPGANLVEQVYSPWYTYTDGMLHLMSDSSKNSAVLSGNSWGPSGSPQGYDNDTMQVDIGVRDAESDTGGDQAFSYILSFMNGNGGTSSQGSPDEAKNIFTIGSTKMQNSDGSQILAINDISSNSAHGPALDGRTIPHMVAPGCSVDSTVPGGYSLMCGTSMASPHVAGASGLFYEFYRGLTGVDPSPALVKAAFLPVAYDLAGFDDADGGTLGHPFDSKQGWGRMDLEAVLDSTVSILYFDDPMVFDNSGEVWERTLYIDNPGEPVKMMLVWTDAPGHGLGGSTPAWNNNLDLVVIDGTDTYRGNNFGGSGWSVTGGTADQANNTEGVFLGPTAPTSFTIRVEATNINSDGLPSSGDATDQDFALVVVNAIDQSSAGTITLDRSFYGSGVAIAMEVSDADIQGDGTIYVDVSSDSEMTPESVALTETGSNSGIFTGSILTTSSSGVAGELTISDGDSIQAVYHDADNGTGNPEDKTAYATADLAGPVISGVTVTNIGTTYATVEWTTSEPGTSYVRYATGTPPGTEVFVSGYGTSHSVDLTGLDPCTLYYLEVESTDVAGNTTVDDNSAVYYSFTTYELVIFLEANMDTDPGWTTGSEWAWGQPLGLGGEYGNPDPDSGYTGNNVYGVNLSGDYPNSMGSTDYLISPEFDCSDTTFVSFTFMAWLGVERNSWDNASIDVSNDGGSLWTNIWANDDTSLDGGTWDLWEFDISAIAAGYSQVSIRWGIGPTDSSWQYCGWNIDDVSVSYTSECVLATPTPAPTSTPPPCINHGDVNASGNVTAGDAQMTFEIALEVITPTYEEECAADCNGDGEVTAGDAQLVFETALGINTCVDPL